MGQMDYVLTCKNDLFIKSDFSNGRNTKSRMRYYLWDKIVFDLLNTIGHAHTSKKTAIMPDDPV